MKNDAIERLRSLDIAGALKAVNYKYFGDYPLSEGQWDAVWIMHSAAEALPSLLSHIDALEARVEELNRERVPAQWYADEKARAEAAERALAEAVEVLRPFAELADFYENCEQHPHGCPDTALCGELPDLTVGQFRQARAFLTKRGEK